MGCRIEWAAARAEIGLLMAGLRNFALGAAFGQSPRANTPSRAPDAVEPSSLLARGHETSRLMRIQPISHQALQPAAQSGCGQRVGFATQLPDAGRTGVHQSRERERGQLARSIIISALPNRASRRRRARTCPLSSARRRRQLELRDWSKPICSSRGPKFGPSLQLELGRGSQLGGAGRA